MVSKEIKRSSKHFITSNSIFLILISKFGYFFFFFCFSAIQLCEWVSSGIGRSQQRKGRRRSLSVKIENVIVLISGKSDTSIVLLKKLKYMHVLPGYMWTTKNGDSNKSRL